MHAKRIISCLDVKNGRVVKGVNFEGIKDVGDPVECAIEYNKQGVDELVFYDITASHEGRKAIIDVVRNTAKNVFVPLCVGGGISSVDDFRDYLRAGADKISINSSAVKNPQLIKDASEVFGSQCVVVGMDVKRNEFGQFTIYINGGRLDMKIDAVQWAKKVEELGAGEICLNSIDTDGTKAGFDIEMLNAVCGAVNIPVIASGGAGTMEHFYDALTVGKADAALAASLFHFKEIEIKDLKEYLHKKSISVRR